MTAPGPVVSDFDPTCPTCGQPWAIPGEEWRPIVGWEGLYEISDQGRLRSIRRRRLLHCWLATSGYRRVMLYRHQSRIDTGLHNLVAEAFWGPPPQGYVPNHKDGDKTNNRASNLEWVSLSGNLLHAYRTGLRTGRKGTLNGRAKLTAEETELVRQSFEPGTIVAKQFGITPARVSQIRRS